MDAAAELLPPRLDDFRLPPGLELPRNIVLTESEAAAFVREPEDRFRRRRLNGTGPTFIRREDETFGAKYLVWDLLAWLVQSRRTEMPERPRRGSRRSAAQAAA
ncbi:hypothetical protein WYO_5465 [Methylobacterium sp. GXF4]|uniref:hypothetical protein n=1 Tax=Methylobacterium sp. GXF4 TaxID=1096546 RepID=UPI000269AA01|nr:hypothetical protein [Methylobacterium sp. GXF4]EIZ81877.1 hypothetical protein WYO_5465 [Methylobacterium sp. GXF4]